MSNDDYKKPELKDLNMDDSKDIIVKIDYTRGKPFQEWSISDLETIYRTPAEVEKIFLHYLRNKRKISVNYDYKFMIEYIAKNKISDHYESLKFILNRIKSSVTYSLEFPSKNPGSPKIRMHRGGVKFYFNYTSDTISLLNYMNDDIMDIIKMNIEYNLGGADDFLIYKDNTLETLGNYPEYLKEIKKYLILNNANINKFVDGYSYVNEIEYTMDDFYADLPLEMSLGVVI